MVDLIRMVRAEGEIADVRPDWVGEWRGWGWRIEGEGENPPAPEPEPDDLPEVADEPAPEVSAEPLVAKHRGRGSFSIMRGDVEVAEGLNKAEAAAFNALSDDERERFVAERRA